MKNQMNCIQSDPYQRTLHIKVKQTQRLLLGVGILLLSTIASQAQSLLPSASKPDPSKNQKSIQLGDNHYRVVPVGQYGEQASQTDSMVAQATENKTESKRPLFQQAFIQNDLGTQNSIALTQCETCEPASPMSIRAQLDQACNACGSLSGAFGCLHCDSYVYAVAEALHLDRDKEDTATISSRYGLSGFRREMGTRITLGRIPNCVSGWESTFTGIINWSSSGGLEAPIFRIQSNLEPIPPVSADDISAFNDAFIQTVNYDARYWSVEVNRTYVGWEVAKMLCGLRYIDFEEEYRVFSENDNETGSIRSDINNSLIGFQIGMDLTYPILRKTYIDFRGRAGVYANFLDLDLAIINDNEFAAGVSDRSVRAAGQFELGIGLRYEVTPKFSLKCGAEVWYLSGVGKSYDQLDNGIMGRNSVEGYEELITSALTYGAELRY